MTQTITSLAISIPIISRLPGSLLYADEQHTNVRFGGFELGTSSGELTGRDGKIPLRYVETLRRRGYRLMVAVERAGAVGSARGAAQSAADTEPRLESGTKTGGRWRVVVSIAAALLVIFGLGYGYSRRAVHATSKLTDRDRTVLADFATGRTIRCSARRCGRD